MLSLELNGKMTPSLEVPSLWVHDIDDNLSLVSIGFYVSVSISYLLQGKHAVDHRSQQAGGGDRV